MEEEKPSEPEAPKEPVEEKPAEPQEEIAAVVVAGPAAEPEAQEEPKETEESPLPQIVQHTHCMRCGKIDFDFQRDRICKVCAGIDISGNAKVAEILIVNQG